MVPDFFMDYTLYNKYINTPIGWLDLISDETSLFKIRFCDKKGENSDKQPKIIQETENQINAYFSGKRKMFDLKLNPLGTGFQKKVWNLLLDVSFGETSTYLDIAVKTGSKNNSRAVGLANGKNPIPIVIPCHRIIGNNGKLTGYAGGMQIKRMLLQHEMKYSVSNDRLF